MRSLSAKTGLLAFGLLLLASAAARAETKIGFINSDQILEKFPGTRSAMETFNQDVKQWNDDATTRKQELDKLGRELADKSPMLSDDKRREAEQDYQRKSTEYDQFVQSVWGPNGLVVKRNEEILRPIISKIQTILAKIGSDEGFDLILDAANGNILYANQELDLTQRVIDELSKEP
jgi:outer membrane protein